MCSKKCARVDDEHDSDNDGNNDNSRDSVIDVESRNGNNSWALFVETNINLSHDFQIKYDEGASSP